MTDANRKYKITTRQFLILRLVIDGRTNHQIAFATGLTISGVNDHIRRLLRKADVPVGVHCTLSKMKLLIWAVESGLIEIKKKRTVTVDDKKEAYEDAARIAGAHHMANLHKRAESHGDADMHTVD